MGLELDPIARGVKGVRTILALRLELVHLGSGRRVDAVGLMRMAS